MGDFSQRVVLALRTARETIMKYAKAAPGQRGLFGGGFEGGVTSVQHQINFDSPTPTATPKASPSNADFERLHPRDDHGRFIEKSQMEQAKTNQRMADALRARVTNPEERAKLDAAIGKQQGPEAAPAAAGNSSADQRTLDDKKKFRQAVIADREAAHGDIDAHYDWVGSDEYTNAHAKLMQNPRYSALIKMSEKEADEWNKKNPDADFESPPYSKTDKQLDSMIIEHLESNGTRVSDKVKQYVGYKPAPAAAAPEKTPEQAPAGAPKEIPQTVRESVKRNLDTLNQLHNDMEKAGTLGDRYRSDAAINNDKRVKAAREVIDEFRQRATKLGIDPEQLITELGGEPPRDAHDKMLNWHNEPTKASKTADPAQSQPESPSLAPTEPPPVPKPALDMFGEPIKPEKKESPPPEPPKKDGPQGALFDNRGLPGQMSMFAENGVPDEMLHKSARRGDDSGLPTSKPVAQPEIESESPTAIDKATPKVRKAIDKAANSLGIADFGEEIGGARKHKAVPTGPKGGSKQPKVDDDRPAWARRYRVAEDANNPGEYFIVDERTNKPYFDETRSEAGSFSRRLERMMGSRRGGNNFKSKEDAEKKIAHIEVNRNHGIGGVRKPADGMEQEWAIYRQVSDKKRPLVRRGFKTREEAEQYLNANPEQIIEHKFPDYETYQYLESVERKGKDVRKGDVKPNDFQDVFNFRGGQFGNWQMNKDGQTSLNHAYEALHDLADTLGLPARAMSLNGDLAIAFGARGNGGKHSARAHYEPDQKVINLTKMAGAGTLAHEWSHALDHYVGELAHGKGENYGISKGGWKAGAIRPELKAAAKVLRDALHSKEVTSAIQAPKETTASREEKENEELRKAKQNDTTVSYPRTVPALLWNVRQSMKSRAEWKKKKIDPKLLKEFDDLSEKVSQGDYGKQINVATRNSRFGGYSSFENVEKLNQLHKKMVGSSFHTADRESTGNSIYHRILANKTQESRLKDAQEGKTETRRVNTNYATEASHMDMFQSGDYYSHPQEMFARAFEAYMDDKIAKAGNRSDYLIGKGTTDNKRYSMYDMKPFPEGEEREAINQAFENFFKELKHQEREDDKGKHVQLYGKQASVTHYSAKLNRAIIRAVATLT